MDKLEGRITMDSNMKKADAPQDQKSIREHRPPYNKLRELLNQSYQHNREMRARIATLEKENACLLEQLEEVSR